MAHRARVTTLALLMLTAACGGGGGGGTTTPPGPNPITPGPVTPPKTSARYTQPPWDVSTFFGPTGGGIAAPASGVNRADGDNLTGTFTNSDNGGFGGTLRGVLTGTLDSGTFDGTLITVTPNGCRAERRYTGPLTAASLNWTPGDHLNDCGGASPLTVPVQAPAVTTPPCSFSVTLAADNVPAAGATRTATVGTQGGCTWHAASTVAWITLSRNQANSSGDVTVTIAPNTGPARSGSVEIAGRAFTITQDGVTTGCSYTLGAQTLTVSSGGGTQTVSVQTTATCTWTTSSNASWLSIDSGASGTGNGSVVVTAAANPGGARTGTLTIAGQPVIVNQAAAAGPCSYAAAASTTSFTAAGGGGSVTISAGAGCSWSAASAVPWITLSSAGGSGAASVNFTVAANPDAAARSGVLTIAGQAITINQAGASCSYTVNASTTSFAAGGGTATLSVTTASGCAWTATTSDAWISFASPSGSGAGTVAVTIAANSGAARSGSISVGGQSLTITQAASGPQCTYTVTPASLPVAIGGGSPTISITAPAGCSWSVTTQANWITASPTTGVGNGTVTLTVAANTSAARSATVTAAGQSITVDQAGTVACTFALGPPTTDHQVGPSGGDTLITVIPSSPSCTWTFSSGVSWLTLSRITVPNGNDILKVTAASNSGPTRSGSIVVAGHTVNFTQVGFSCTFTVTPTTVNAPADGGTVNVSVTASSQTCSWQALTNSAFLGVTQGNSGTGDGTVVISATFNNTTSSRSGTVTVAGTTVTVNQPTNYFPVTLISSFNPDPAPYGNTSGCNLPGGPGNPTWFFRLTMSQTGPRITVSDFTFRFFNTAGNPGGSSTASAAVFQTIFGSPDLLGSPAQQSGDLCVYLTSSAGFVEITFNGTDALGYPRSLTTKRLQLLPAPGSAASTTGGAMRGGGGAGGGGR